MSFCTVPWDRGVKLSLEDVCELLVPMLENESLCLRLRVTQNLMWAAAQNLMWAAACCFPLLVLVAKQPSGIYSTYKLLREPKALRICKHPFPQSTSVI